jgi:hypothetical protein
MKVASLGVAMGAVILCSSATPALASDAQIIITRSPVKPGQRVRVTTECPTLGYDTYTLNVDGKAWSNGRLVRGSAIGVGIAPKRRGPHKISGSCLPCPGSIAKPVAIKGANLTVDVPEPKRRYPRGGVETGFGGMAFPARVAR